ncbi:MAG: TIGR00159 family protein, partial [Cyanobacteria bacterium P01_D01_bin.128]
CVVVSEETGSISVAEKGSLNRPLTSSKLKDLLRSRFSQSAEHEAVAPQLRSLGRQLLRRSRRLVMLLLGQADSASRSRK